MRKFLLVSVALNVLALVLLTAFVILPRWYYGLGRKAQLVMEISLLAIIVGQILAAVIWQKRYKGNIIIGILPILIPLWYYFKLVDH